MRCSDTAVVHQSAWEVSIVLVTDESRSISSLATVGSATLDMTGRPAKRLCGRSAKRPDAELSAELPLKADVGGGEGIANRRAKRLSNPIESQPTELVRVRRNHVVTSRHIGVTDGGPTSPDSPMRTTQRPFGAVRGGAAGPDELRQLYAEASHQTDKLACGVRLHLPCTYGNRVENGRFASD